MVLQPEVQVLDQRSTSQLTNRLAYIRWLTAEPTLDLVELADACQHVSGGSSAPADVTGTQRSSGRTAPPLHRAAT
jgi:hypothetical protein